MRFTIRAAALAVVALLAVAVVLVQPGGLPLAVAQPAAQVADDLALVPADAIGFVHVRAADLWKNEVFAGFRKTFEKAGPKALAALDARFVPKVSTFDRATAFLLPVGERKQPAPFVVLRFSAPFDPAEVVAAYLPKATTEKVGAKKYFTSESTEFELYFPDDRTIVIGPNEGMAAYLKHEFPKTGAMSAGLKLAASGKPVVASLDLSALPIPRKLLAELPDEVKPLFKAEHLTVSLDLGAAATVQLTAGYKDAAAARDAEKAVQALAEVFRKELAKTKADIEKRLFEPRAKGSRPLGELPEALFSVFALGAINEVDELLADPGKYVKRDGADLTASVTLPKDLVVAVGGVAAIGAGLLLPAIQKVREAASRAQSMNNLRQIGIACHAYHDANRQFPADITDKAGKPLLSWRVAILPYIEQQALYNQFKLDEPWDSKHNKPFSQMIVKTYLSPQAEMPDRPGMTHYQGFVGPGTMFEPGKKVSVANVTDGLSNTILVVETAEAVEWAKPGGIPFDPKKPLPKLVGAGNPDIMQTLMADGSVRAVNLKAITEKTLKFAIQRDDGNVLGDDW